MRRRGSRLRNTGSSLIFRYNASINNATIINDVSGNENTGAAIGTMTYKDILPFTQDTGYNFYPQSSGVIASHNFNNAFCSSENAFTVCGGYFPDNGGSSAGLKQVIIRYGTGFETDCNLCIFTRFTAPEIHDLVVNVRGNETVIATGLSRAQRIIFFAWDGVNAILRFEGNYYTISVGTNAEITGLNLTYFNSLKGHCGEAVGFNSGMSQTEINNWISNMQYTGGVIT